MKYQLLQEANVPILYPLKTTRNQKFSGVFTGNTHWPEMLQKSFPPPIAVCMHFINRLLRSKYNHKCVTIIRCMNKINMFRNESRNPATSKMEPFVTIVNTFNLLTIVTKNSTLDIFEVLG